MRHNLLAWVTDKSSELEKAAAAVLREALDAVDVHPCDEGDDTVAAKSLSQPLFKLLTALLKRSEMLEGACSEPQGVDGRLAVPATGRPKVTIQRVHDNSGDILYCEVAVGEGSIIQRQVARLDQPGAGLQKAILAATGVSLTTEEICEVKAASRYQMEKEAGRVKAYLERSPKGTVATMKCGLNFWLNGAGDLVWDEWIKPGATEPCEVSPKAIQDVEDIDSDELYRVASYIRDWLFCPRTVEVDMMWLLEASKSKS